MSKRKTNSFSTLSLCSMVLAMLTVWGCSTPKFTCPAYTEYKHQALADSTDPSNSLKIYYAYPVIEEAAKTDSAATDGTNATNTEEVVADSAATNEEVPQENDLAKEVEEEEWKPYPYTFFNIRMDVDSLGKPSSYKPVNTKYNGLVDKKSKKKGKIININVDKELSEDKKRSNYIYVESEATTLPQ